DFIVEVVAALAMLSVLGIVGSVSYALKVRSGLSRLGSSMESTKKEMASVIRRVEEVAQDGKDGRRKLYERIENHEVAAVDSIKRLGETIDKRLDSITAMLQKSLTDNASLSTRMEIMDQRGTKYHQDLNDRNKK
ncbi:MAG: hypothetical protein OXI23_09690, partial [Gemmatimonadota bacterium]|nr:hypothetical protein [Gemmatimonadota bacterium]